MEKHFEDYAVVEQDFLGDEDRIQKVLALVPHEDILLLVNFNKLASKINSRVRIECYKTLVPLKIQSSFVFLASSCFRRQRCASKVFSEFS